MSRQNCWCVVDFDDNFVIVRKMKQFPSGELSDGEDYIVKTVGFNQSYRFWDCYNNLQFGSCPFYIPED